MMANSRSIKEILERQIETLRNLEMTTTLHKSKDELEEVLLEIQSDVSNISDGVHQLKKHLQLMKEQNYKCQELLVLIQELDDKVVYMEKNVPEKLIHDYHHSENELSLLLREIFPPNEEKAEKEVQEEKISPVKDCKKALFKEADVYPTIPLITKQEFASVPKYMIGRQSLEMLNNFVQTLNEILKAKYTFLSLGRANAKEQGKFDLYLQYEELQLDICSKNERVYFFIEEDYTNHTKKKFKKNDLSLIAVLRHCKRLKEHRVKKLSRYVLVQ